MPNLSETAAELMVYLNEYVPTENRQMVQALALAEEVGEFVAAYRRWSGNARRNGTYDEMAAELADVVITAYVTADSIGLDLDAEIEKKLKVIFSRPWKDES